MDYQHFHCVSLNHIQNNLEYLILNMIHLVTQTLHVGADILNLLLLYKLFTFFVFLFTYNKY